MSKTKKKVLEKIHNERDNYGFMLEKDDIYPKMFNNETYWTPKMPTGTSIIEFR